MNELWEKYPWLKTYLFPISIGSIGLLFILVGLITTFQPHQQETLHFEQKPSVKGVAVVAKPTLQNQIIVDVAGAVIKQGLYHLTSDSRVQDALDAAGGISENADKKYVEQQINLAAKLVDGSKIYIPHQGESVASASQSEPGSIAQSSTVNINTATAEQLDGLPGVGPVTAEKIISGRPYADVQDLLTKKIISASILTKIKDRIGLY